MWGAWGGMWGAWAAALVRSTRALKGCPRAFRRAGHHRRAGRGGGGGAGALVQSVCVPGGGGAEELRAPFQPPLQSPNQSRCCGVSGTSRWDHSPSPVSVDPPPSATIHTPTGGGAVCMREPPPPPPPPIPSPHVCVTPAGDWVVGEGSSGYCTTCGGCVQPQHQTLESAGTAVLSECSDRLQSTSPKVSGGSVAAGTSTPRVGGGGGGPVTRPLLAAQPEPR